MIRAGAAPLLVAEGLRNPLVVPLWFGRVDKGGEGALILNPGYEIHSLVC